MDAASPEAGPGAGRLVMVVGPSGAGKDSLIRIARDALAGDARYVFPRRLVTRPASGAEDNDEISVARFETLRREGGFAASWTAHGLGYGLPREIDGAIAGGRTVVCNVSRQAVAELRGRYGRTCVVEVTAPREVLERRLLARARAEDGPLEGRLVRAPTAEIRPDAVIVNVGELAAAAEAFLRVLR